VPKPKLPVGSVAPPFTLPGLNDNSIDATSFNGSGTVLLFWNSACGFCQQMVPELKDWEVRKPTNAPRLIVVSTTAVREKCVRFRLSS
jgi:thiol-disulfide isomerase/thioredoxin